MTIYDVEETLQQIHELNEEIKASEAKRDYSIAFHELKIATAKKICAEETENQRIEIERLKYSLEQYYKENPPKRGKSLKFSGGSFGYSKQPPQFYIGEDELKNDNPKLVAVVKAGYGEFLKIAESVDWAKFKSWLSVEEDGSVSHKLTGEILPDLRAVIRADKFTVKL